METPDAPAGEGCFALWKTCAKALSQLGFRDNYSPFLSFFRSLMEVTALTRSTSVRRPLVAAYSLIHRLVR